MSAYSTLRRLARQGPPTAAAAQAQCELCSQTIPDEHRHLLELPSRQVRCVCYACSVLFARAAASEGGSRFRLIPERRLYLPDFDLTDAEWDRLRIPVGMAYILSQGLAFYPGPLGATQAFLDADLWQQVQDRNPVLRQMQPDVEALLVNRVRGSREHYLVPIDECYRLVGVIRAAWRGLTGGAQAWATVDSFFQALRARSKTFSQVTK
jgi:hypothetical protein